jgi:hypothetical protein
VRVRRGPASAFSTIRSIRSSAVLCS